MFEAIVTPYMHPLNPDPTRIQAKGRLHPPVRCLLCDIYGTLFISGSGDIGSAGCTGAQEKALGELLAKYDLPFSADQVRQRLRGAIEADHRRARAMGTDFPEVRIDQLWQTVLGWSNLDRVQKFAVEYEMILNPVWPMPGLEDLLAHCTGKGIRLGIISNAQFFTPLLFEWFLGADATALGFDPRLTFYSYAHALAKPSLGLFRLAREQLDRMGIVARQVAYIGNDMRNDIVAAHGGGFQTILFAGDARSLRLRKDDPCCRKASADLVVTRLDQLKPYLP